MTELNRVAAALGERGIEMDVENTGGGCIVGWVLLGSDGDAYLGVSIEEPGLFLVCRYVDSYLDTGKNLHGDGYVSFERAVELVMHQVHAATGTF